MAVLSSQSHQVDWRNFIRISGLFLDIDRIIIESELDKIYREVPEFREMLPAMRLMAEGQFEGKVVIRPPKKILGMSLEQNGSARPDGAIIVSPQKMRHKTYLGIDNQLYPLSFTRVLLHELVHMADPAWLALFNAGHQQFPAFFGNRTQRWKKHLRNREESVKSVDQFKWALEYAGTFLEDYAIERTSDLMFRYYGEPFRDKAYHGLDIEISSWEEELLSEGDIMNPQPAGTDQDGSSTLSPGSNISQSDRSMHVVSTFMNILSDENWEEKATQYRDEEDDRLDQKYDEMTADLRARRDDARQQHREARRQYWANRRNDGTDKGRSV